MAVKIFYHYYGFKIVKRQEPFMLMKTHNLLPADKIAKKDFSSSLQQQIVSY